MRGQAIAVARPVTAAEHRRPASADPGNGIRQLPQAGAVQAFLKVEHVALSGVAFGSQGKNLPLQADDSEFQSRQLVVHPLGSQTGFQDFRGKSLGHQPILGVSLAEEPECLGSAGHLHPGTAPEIHRAEQLHQADFPGGRHMGTAAGAAVKARNLHDPHRPGKLLLRPVGYLRQLFRTGIPAADGKVRPDRLVGLRLDFLQCLLRNHPVKIDGSHIRTHVKSGVMVTVPPVDNAGDDVLAAVLLHPPEPGLPVDGSLHRLSRFQGGGTVVRHRLPPLMGIQHPDAAKDAGVSCLSAPLGVEGGGIQGNDKRILFRLAGQNLRPEGFQMAVFVI